MHSLHIFWTQTHTCLIFFPLFVSSHPHLIFLALLLPSHPQVGDYVLSPTCVVERKAIPDLTQSLASGRLYSQVCITLDLNRNWK